MGWTSIYQLFCGSLGTRVMTHSQMSCQFFWWRNSNKFSMGFWIPWGGFDKAQNQMMPCQKGIKIVKLCPAFGQSHKYHMVGCIFPVYIYIFIYSHYPITRPIYLHIPIKLIEPQCLLLPSCSISSITLKPWSKIPKNIPSNWMISRSSTLWSTNITMENHHFYRANQLFLRPCSIAFCLFTRVYPRPDDRCHVAGRYHPRSK